MAVQTRVSRVVTCVCKVLCSYCSASLLELPHLADFVFVRVTGVAGQPRPERSATSPNLLAKRVTLPNGVLNQPVA